MKFYISYFYQVRNMDKNCIPISTAKWDPKWFHNFHSQNHIFQDKNGVINGLRADSLAPKTAECCECEDKNLSNISCTFLESYMRQLRSLNFKQFISTCENFARDNNYQNPNIILLVHEAPNNSCSERRPLQKWFKENGFNLPEWHQN